MSNFCPHCGAAVSENNAKNCVACGKPLSDSSETTKNDSFNDSKEKLFNFAKNLKELSIKASEDLRSDETKAKIKDFANQAQSFASEKTKDLKEEFEKINEARKATANEAKDFESTSKIENSKVIAQSFWSKLSSKQKGLFIGFPLFLFVCFMAIFEKSNSAFVGKDSNSDAISSLKQYRFESCKFRAALIEWKIRDDLGGFSSREESANFTKPASDRFNSFDKEFSSNYKHIKSWVKDDSKKQAYANCMMNIKDFPCDNIDTYWIPVHKDGTQKCSYP
jgi:hypothetical protein